MDKPISKLLSTTFLIHMLIGAILGLTLWLVPGFTMTLLGWVPQWVQLPESTAQVPGQTFVDPVMTRVLGAALLALAFSSFRGWRATQWSQVALLVELEAAFCLLALIAFLAGFFTLGRPMPLIGWVLTAVLALFTVAWGAALREEFRTAPVQKPA